MTDHVSLREFIESILVERDKALTLTRENLERRLDTLNQLRGEVTKDRDLYLQKPVYDQMHGDLTRRVGQLESMQAKIIGIGMAAVFFSGIFGVIIGKIWKP